MPKSSLTWYLSDSRAILNEIKTIPRQVIATEINESRQVVSYRVNHVWPESLPDLLRVLNLAGYEIRRKEDV